VLDATGADAVMIGRAAQGRPWIFREIEHFLPPARSCRRRGSTKSTRYCAALWPSSTRFYGLEAGVRVARKHISWYTKGWRARPLSATP
jgi:tRNA-dihydrouridine synthase B